MSVREEAHSLVERDTELARLRSLLRAAGEREGGFALVEGAPGIGKTALLDAAAQMARDQGFEVLRARGSDLESGFGFGVARQLFEGPLRASAESERANLLLGAAAHAGPLLGFGTDSAPLEPLEPTFRALHGLYWLVATWCERAPVLIVIDDLQWADAASLRFLDYLVGRIDELPLAIALAVRSGEPGAATIPIGRLLERAGVRPLPVGPLTEAGVADVTAALLDVRPDPGFVASCHRLTAGNAFFLTQILAEVRAQGLEPVEASAAALDRLGTSAVGRVVLARVARLDAAAADLARALAILGPGTEMRRAALLAGLEQGAAHQAAEALVAASLIEPGEQLNFVHPIVQLAIGEDLPAHRRAAMHRHAARILAAEGAAPEQVASHLLATTGEGDPEVVEQLRAAAGGARANGAPEAATLYLTRALAEPPSAGELASVLEELGTAELLAGNPLCIEHLGAALERTTAPEDRARIALGFAKVLMATGQAESTLATLAGVADGLERDAPELSLALRTHEVCFASMMLDHCDAAVERLAQLPATSSNPTTRRLLLAARTFHAFAGEAPPGDIDARIREVLEGDRVLDEIPLDHPAVAFAIWPATAAAAPELARAFEFVDRMISETTSRGALMGVTIGLYWRSLCHHFSGAIADAEADARRSLDLTIANGWPMGVPGAASSLICALLERSAVDDAEAVLDVAWSQSGEMPRWRHFTLLLEARAELRTAQDRLDDALADLREAGERHRLVGMLNPAFSPWRSRLALLEQRAGNSGRALELVDEEIGLARGLDLARPLGIALRARGEMYDDTEALEESVAALGETTARLELARSQVALGAALRRANQRAQSRDPLRAGMDLARRCGATALAERARAELAATGARPRRLVLTGVDSLTASERRVAKLASSGRSNPEIAQSLFVTRATIETHLHSIYRKLGIKGRAELAGVLGEDDKPH